jgi:hypothetical protein
MASGKPEPYRLGFLTAIELPDRGFVGGLLVTNHFGRPLEFQCTLPVRPNATQVMLYGPTLEPFLLGELIGATLLEKSGIKPQLVLTDREQILSVRDHCDSPVVFVPADKRSRRAASPAAAEAGSGEGAPGEAAVAQASSAEIASALHGGALVGEVANSGRGVDEQSPVDRTGTIKLGRQHVRVHAAHPADREKVSTEAHQVAADVDLHEPFDRVREALQETLKSAGGR